MAPAILTVYVCRIFPFDGKVRLSATRLPTWLELLPGGTPQEKDDGGPAGGDSGTPAHSGSGAVTSRAPGEESEVAALAESGAAVVTTGLSPADKRDDRLREE